MTTEEWLAATLASAPPLSPAQIAILRPVFRPVIPHTAETAPAVNEGRSVTAQKG